MNNQKIKDEYMNIKASENLEKKVKLIMRKEKTRKFNKIASGAVAAALVVTIGAFNAFPALAMSVQDVPVLNTFVKIVTLSRYEVQDNGYEANIATPEIQGLLDKELEAKLNAQFKENANAVIAAFEQDVAALKAEFGEETVHMGVTSDYQVKTDTPEILAIDNYIFTAVGSSSTVHKFYTIDKKSGELLTLAGLFKADTDYVTPISAYIKEQMIQANQNESGMFWVAEDEIAAIFTAIKPDQNFYINNQGNLVICFDKYEVAAGAQGSPEFIIPTDVIQDLVASQLLK